MTELLEQRKNIYRQLEDHALMIENLQKQIASTEKLATMGTMACTMAHEFNNILMPIINYAELAQQHLDDKELVNKALGKIIKNGQMASTMIENLLGFTRNNSMTAEKMSLLGLVQDCFLCLVRNLEKDGIRVEVNIPEDMEIVAVHNQMQQVLMNMIINARQAMVGKGGRLVITGKEKDYESVIEIADTGPGIAPEVIDHIFEPFYTTKSGDHLTETGGTGLGLMVCKNIIDSHGGRIEVVSAVGKGTRFTISLPM